ncbi:MAG: hypothetical protein ACI9XO_003128 [Paraglaciecola sp.]|jgi:hypothetical protein
MKMTAQLAYKTVQGFRRTAQDGVGLYRLGLVFLLVGLLSFSMQAKDCLFGNLAEALGFEQTFISTQEYTKTLKKEFPITNDGNTILENKYGKIEVKIWDKDRVKVNVNVVVKTSSESEAQAVFERIKINFENGETFVSAKTSIESSQKSWWGWNDESTEFQINYEVLIPTNGALDLTNKYGDAQIATIGGKAKVAVKHGDFTMEEAKNDLTVDLAYGAGTVVRARDITGEVAYSKFRIKDAQDIILDTRYSKVNVERAEDLKIESRYDNYEVGEARDFKCQARYGDMDILAVDNVICNSRYTEYRIEKVGNKADFNLEFGGVTVEQITKGFSEVILVGKYTDYRLTVEPGASYQLDANAEYAGIKYPSKMNVTHEVDKGKMHTVKGHQGSQNARSVIKASLNYGALRVKNG